MTSGGWNAFREASKHKAIAATAAAELERPAVSHRVSIPPLDEPALKVHETTPSTAPILPDEEPPLSDEPVAPEDGAAPEDELPREQDPDELVAAAVAMMTPAWPAAPAKSRLRPKMKMPPNLKGMLKSVGPWYALAVVPVIGTAGLIALRAGLDPYAFCLQWWDLLFGVVAASAAGLFIGFAIWKGLKDAWQPGAPALGVLAVAAPLWLALSLAGGNGCGVVPDVRAAATAAPAIVVPPLPPPVEVGPIWAVPMPQQRPPELHYQFSPRQFDIETGQLHVSPPPQL